LNSFRFPFGDTLGVVFTGKFTSIFAASNDRFASRVKQIAIRAKKLAQNINPIHRIIPHEPIKVNSALFFNRVP
jgi:hypothetical protein